MRLEQVLAQWAKGISISSGTQESAVASVAGRWTNEYGSVAEIAVDGELWHLIVDIPDPEEATGLWTTVHTGADTFR